MNPKITPYKSKSFKTRYVICTNNEGYQASLEKRKIYRVLPDPQANAHKLMRIIDESGEDYLYPADWFVPISLSLTVAKALVLAA